MPRFPRPVLFLGLTLAGCGDAELCKVRQEEAYQAWNEVADYYQRMADLKRRERQDVHAEVQLQTEARERHERAAQIARYRQTTGLEDVATGAEYIAPDDATRHGRAARAASGRANSTADGEELGIAELMAVDEVIAELERKSQAAGRIRDLAQGDPKTAWAAASAGVALTGTELVGLAEQASRDAMEVCSR